MADGYRLEQEDILGKGRELIDDFAAQGNFCGFYKAAWKLIFEINIDYNTAVQARNKDRERLYVNAVIATTNMVESTINYEEVNNA